MLFEIKKSNIKELAQDDPKFHKTFIRKTIWIVIVIVLLWL